MNTKNMNIEINVVLYSYIYKSNDETENADLKFNRILKTDILVCENGLKHPNNNLKTFNKVCGSARNVF